MLFYNFVVGIIALPRDAHNVSQTNLIFLLFVPDDATGR